MASKKIPSFVIGMVFVLGIMAVIVGLTYGVSSAITAIKELDDRFGKDATIGSISVAGLTRNEAIDKIAAETNEWYDKTKFTLIYKEVKKSVNPQVVLFKVDESVKNAKKNGESPLYIEIQTEYYQSIVNNLNVESLKEGLDTLTLEHSFSSKALDLQSGKHTIDLYEYIKEEYKEEPTVIADSSIGVLENRDMIAGWIEHLNEFPVEADSTVSLLHMMKEKGISPVDSDALDILATGLYQTVLKTNFKMYERHTSLELPKYAPLGYEVKMSAETMDLVFHNPNHMEYSLQFELVDNHLFTRLIGIPFYYQYHSEVKDRQDFSPKRIIQFDEKMPANQMIVRESGKNGMMVKVYRNVDGPFGPVKQELISEDFYPPNHRIIVMAPTVQEKAEEDKEVMVDENNEETETKEEENEKAKSEEMETKENKKENETKVANE